MNISSTLTVDLGERSYPIVIGNGLLGDFGLADYFNGPDCLVVNKQQLERTQRGRSRPMLENGDPEKVLEELMTARDPLYREIADLIIDTDGRRVQTVAREIHENL